MSDLERQHFGEDAPLTTLEEFKTWIVCENEDFLVLNKPGWLVCHPSKNGPMSSLVGAARVYLSGAENIHLVSRLDRETSGLVVLAKNKKSASLTQKAIEQKRVSKKYLAILRGRLEGSYTVAQPLAGDLRVARRLIGRQQRPVGVHALGRLLCDEGGVIHPRIIICRHVFSFP